jgi:hypothetical protein
MKIRNGFVSNSSSSSFTCEVCGYTDGGFDVCLSDFEMVECENGHIFCKEHIINKEECNEKYDISAKFCPLCSMQAVGDDDAIQYLLTINNTTLLKIKDEIKERFNNYTQLKEFLNEN